MRHPARGTRCGRCSTGREAVARDGSIEFVSPGGKIHLFYDAPKHGAASAPSQAPTWTTELPIYPMSAAPWSWSGPRNTGGRGPRMPACSPSQSVSRHRRGLCHLGRRRMTSDERCGPLSAIATSSRQAHNVCATPLPRGTTASSSRSPDNRPSTWAWASAWALAWASSCCRCSTTSSPDASRHCYK